MLRTTTLSTQALSFHLKSKAEHFASLLAPDFTPKFDTKLYRWLLILEKDGQDIFIRILSE